MEVATSEIELEFDRPTEIIAFPQGIRELFRKEIESFKLQKTL